MGNSTGKFNFATKNVENEVDQVLFRGEIDRHLDWNELKKKLDKLSTSKIIHPKEGKEFSVEDLIWPLANGTRRLEFFSKVFWRVTLNGPQIELYLLICDDIILFVRPKHSMFGSTKKMQLFRHSEHAGVFPTKYMLIKGQNTRRKSILLIQTAKLRPDLFELAFPTCQEMEQCIEAFKNAKAMATNFIRMAGGELWQLDD